MIIYKITCLVNNKCYIGLTTQSIQRRFKQHVRDDNLCVKLRNAMKSHGRENFTVEEIDGANSLSELKYRENFWIYKLDTIINGYNCLEGGNHPVAWNKGTKGLTQANSGSFTSENSRGDKNHFYGKKHSEESIQKQKMSLWCYQQTDAYKEQLKRLASSEKVKKTSIENLKKARSNPNWKESIIRSKQIPPLEVYDSSGVFIKTYILRSEFCKEYGFCADLLSYYLKNKKYFFKQFIVKLENDSVSIDDILKTKNNTRNYYNSLKNTSIVNTTTGDIYTDIKQCCSTLLIKKAQALNVLIGNRSDVGGNVLEYFDHPKKQEYAIKRSKFKIKKSKSVFCENNNITYSSIRKAAKAWGLSCNTLKRHLNKGDANLSGVIFKYKNNL